MIETMFPPGTPVRVQQTVHRLGRPVLVESVGVVEAWEHSPTGSWFVGRRKNKLWLYRLKLRKADGELTLLVLDDATAIAAIEGVKAT